MMTPPEIAQVQVIMLLKTNHINTFVMFLQMLLLFLFLFAKKLQSDLSRSARHNSPVQAH
jgi:hypothetical protein